MSNTRSRDGLRDFRTSSTEEGPLVVPPNSGPPATKAGATVPGPRSGAGAGLVRMPLFCSVYGGFSIVEGRLERDALHWLRNLRPVDGDGSGATPPAVLGNYRIIFDEWPGCGICGAKNSTRQAIQGFWVCYQTTCGGARFHCVGERHGEARCGCGSLRPDSFVRVESFEVRGARDAAAQNGSRDASTALPSSKVPALPAPPLVLPRR